MVHQSDHNAHFFYGLYLTWSTDQTVYYAAMGCWNGRVHYKAFREGELTGNYYGTLEYTELSRENHKKHLQRRYHGKGR